MIEPVLFGPTLQNAYEVSLLVDRDDEKLVNTAPELADAITV